MSATAKKPQTIKHSGRKFVVINRSVTCMLLKRAGKPHWFTLKDGKEGELVRHKGFWEALQAHSDNLDETGAVAETIDHKAAVAEFLAAELEGTNDANA